MLIWLRAFFNQFWRAPRKRGNQFHYSTRDRLTMSWRMASAARLIAKGPPYHPRRWMGFCLAATALCSVAHAQVGQIPWAVQPASLPPPTATQIGHISDGSCSIISAYEGWLGKAAGTVQRQIYGFAGATTVAGIEAAITGAQCGFSTRPMSISYGISDTAANILAGNYDTLLANIGTAVQATAPNAIIRLNWEFNGNFYPWGIDPFQNPNAYTPAQFIAVWQREVTKIRAAADVGGENAIKFEWNALLCQGCSDMATGWPGSAYVDYIGLDAYDLNDSGNAANDWTNFWVVPSGINGLTEQISLARTYQKLVAIGELGVGYISGALDDAHGAAMLGYLESWMANTGSTPNGYQKYAYFNYWNTAQPGYCGVIDGEPALGTGSCPPPTSNNFGPTTAGPPYMNGMSAAAFCTAFGSVGAPCVLAPGYYVATNGSDSNPGTLASPFLTFGKCQTAMRSAPPLVCYVRGGSYALPSGGLILTTSDNGETFQYYPPDGLNTPILTTALVASAPAIGISCVGCTLKGLTFAVNGSLDSGCVTITASCIPIEISGANGLQFLSNIIDGENAASPYYLIDVNGPVSGAIIVGNTLKNWGSAGGGDGIILNGTLTNSVVRNNTFSCLTQYGIIDAGGATGNIFANNTFNLIGENPCGTISGGGGGAGINLQTDSGNLLHGNVFTGFQLGYNFVLNNTLGANFIQSNTLGMSANPQVTLNGAPNTVVRKNVVSAPAGANGFNLGDEHDSPPARTNTSNNLLVLNNQITSGLEGLYLTGTSNSIILGNVVTQSGNSTSGSDCGVPAPHFAAGLVIGKWSCVNGGSHNNLIILNTISNTLGTADWGILLDTSQNNNTVQFNIVNQNPNPIVDNSGGPNTITNNQTTGSTAPLATAQPIADAGAGAVVASQAAVTLDGSATHLITGGTAGISYAWTQILGPTVGITGGTLVQASFTAPTASTATILGFKLTATNANGSTYDQVYFGVDPSL